MERFAMNQDFPQIKADPLSDAAAFPVLSEAELQQCAEFGTRRTFARGETLFAAGDHPFDCYVIVSGEVCIVDVSTDERRCVLRYGEPGILPATSTCSHGPSGGRLVRGGHCGGSDLHSAGHRAGAFREENLPWASGFGVLFSAGANCCWRPPSRGCACTATRMTGRRWKRWNFSFATACRTVG